MKLKSPLLIFVLALSIKLSAQYAASNFTFLSLTNPETGVNVYGDKYSACWGWYQQTTGREYAIACSKSGTYWVDVTNPITPTVCAFKAGTSTNGVWRETKTYGNYCYVVCDDGSSTGFQIFDMSTLPATVTMVYNSNALFKRGHTCWVNNGRLYVAGVTYSNNTTSSMNVYSLATPTAPVLLRRLNQDYNFISYVHDMYVNNDTVFASCGNQGLYVFKYNAIANNFTQLGSLTTYSGSGYNHSSALTPDKQTLIFTDEVPAGLPIKTADVSNLANIQVLATTNQFPQTTPHNPFMVSNQYCFMSSYQDGTQLYDISNPSNPTLAGFFDTFPQGGGNNNDWTMDDYDGQWGLYPYFPSKNIFALDQKNGIFMINTHLYANPQVSATFNSPSLVCAGSTINCVNTSTGATNYTWTFSGGSPATSTVTNPSVSFASVGIHTISLIATNPSYTSTSTQTVNVVNNTMTTAISSSNAACGTCSTGIASVSLTGGNSPFTYSWSPTGGNSSAASNLLPGCYTVTISDAANCTTSTSTCVAFNTGLLSFINNGDLSVYPNPANDKLVLSFQTASATTIQIKNMLGQLIYDKQFKTTINEIIDTREFPTGTYFVSIDQNNQNSIIKLIINH